MSKKKEEVRILPDGTVIDVSKTGTGSVTVPTTVGSYLAGMNGGAVAPTTPSSPPVPPSSYADGMNSGAVAPTLTPTGDQSMNPDTTPTVVGGTGNVVSGKENTVTNVGNSMSGGATSNGGAVGEQGGNTVETVTPSATPDYTTYKGWLDAINKQYESGVSMAEQVRAELMKLSQAERDRIYADAEAARKRAVIDAGSARKKASTTYGKQAEALGRAGMTGSGYGEYLEGRNYATERGEIVAANQGEAAAKREADYSYQQGMANANSTYAQMKGAAEGTYYQNLVGYEQKVEADKKAAEDAATTDEMNKSATYLELMDIAKSGKYSEEEIRNLATRLGMDDTAVGELAASAKNAAESAPEKSDNAAAYAELLDMVKSGKYTTAEIRDLAGKAGLSSSEITSLDSYGKEAEERAKQAAFKESLAYLTGNETNASIEELGYNPKQTNELKAARDQAQLSVIPTTLANNGAQATFDAIDAAMEGDLLTDDGYREGYFLTFLEMIDGDSDLYGNAGTIETQIQKAETQGKLTAADAASLKKYVQDRTVVSLDKDYGHLTKRGDMAGLFWLSVPGNEQANKSAVTYRVQSGSKELAYLNQIEPTIGQIAKIGDKYYAYVSYDGVGAPQWYHFEQGGKKEKFDELFADLAEKSGGVKRPKHSED